MGTNPEPSPRSIAEAVSELDPNTPTLLCYECRFATGLELGRVRSPESPRNRVSHLIEAAIVSTTLFRVPLIRYVLATVGPAG